MIKLSNVSKSYNLGKSNKFEVLKNVTLEIKDGEFVAIIGKSGAGKSTLLHIISCIDSFEQGEYLLDGTNIKKLNENKRALIRNEKIGVVMQDFALVEDFSALENVMLPLDFAKKKRPNKRSLAENALSSMGMGNITNKSVNCLSGGQKQRVAIARAIVNNPDIILADEPTGALDSKTGGEIIELLKEINTNGTTVVIVTHDMNIARQCGRIIEISDGEIVGDNSTV